MDDPYMDNKVLVFVGL